MKQDLKGKKLMLLSCMQSSCEIVKVAHEMGVIVYETDFYEDSPVKKVVDKAFQVSSRDVDAVVQLCNEEGIDGVFSGFTDSVLSSQQHICEKLGKPFWGDSQNVAICTDKKLFKEACQKVGLPIVPYIELTEYNYKQKLIDIKVPVVFKPVDNSGSRGVYKCYRDEDKEKLFLKSLSYSKSKLVLAEKLMNSEKEFSAYYMLHDGKAYLNAMMDRIIIPSSTDSAPITQAAIFPSLYLYQWRRDIEPYVLKFFDKYNMRNGYVFLQGFCDDNQLYVHEIGYRLSGGVGYKIVEHFCGFNQIEQLIRYSLTGKMDEDKLSRSNPLFNGYGLILESTLTNGTIGSISGVEELQRIDGVIHFYQGHFTGDVLGGAGTTANIFSDTYIVASTVEELSFICSKVGETLKVCDTDGKNMLYSSLDVNRLKKYEETNAN